LGRAAFAEVSLSLSLSLSLMTKAMANIKHTPSQRFNRRKSRAILFLSDINDPGGFMQKRIFDCFTFFNELDLLELRFNELYEKVDFFVLAESPVTFKGKPKDLYYDLNKARFYKFKDKIVHLIIDDMPDSERAWDREHFQRNALRRGLKEAQQKDIIIISDADEIVRPAAIDALRHNDGFVQIGMPMFQYFMNLRETHGWTKVFAFSYDLIDEIPDFNWVRTSQEDAFNKFAGRNKKFVGAGWHFTYLGGAATIREKLSAFSHDEPWFQRMLSPGGIEAQIAAGFEVGNSWNFNRFCPIDSSFPSYVVANLQKYRELGYIRDPYEALADMQLILRNAYQTVLHERQKLAQAQDQYEKMLARFSSLDTNEKTSP
jgi:hypothetical protein